MYWLKSLPRTQLGAALLALILSMAFLGDATAFTMPPLFKGLDKTQDVLDADAEFVADALKNHGNDPVRAAERWIDFGWEAINAVDGEAAVRRLNQAFLIRPDAPGIRYGLMIATHVRGDPPEVTDELYELAVGVMSEDDVHIAHMDYAMIVAERGELEQAITIVRREADTESPDIGSLEFLARLCNATGDSQCFEETMERFQSRRLEVGQ